MTISKLCGSPVLLDEIQLGMKLRVEVTKVASVLNKFRKLRFLIDEVWLVEQNSPAAAIGLVLAHRKVTRITLGFESWPP